MHGIQTKCQKILYDSINNPVATMATKRKRVNGGSEPIIQTEIIFNRTLWFIDSVDFRLGYLCSNELAPCPTLLFVMKMGYNKVNDGEKLVVEQSCRTLPSREVVVQQREMFRHTAILIIFNGFTFPIIFPNGHIGLSFLKIDSLALVAYKKMHQICDLWDFSIF